MELGAGPNAELRIPTGEWHGARRAKREEAVSFRGAPDISKPILAYREGDRIHDGSLSETGRVVAEGKMSEYTPSVRADVRFEGVPMYGSAAAHARIDSEVRGDRPSVQNLAVGLEKERRE
jgi:hypothetical protein